jgi:hypothetical protein
VLSGEQQAGSAVITSWAFIDPPIGRPSLAG